MSRTNTKMMAATLTLAFALTMVPATAMATETTTFQDVPQGHWAYDAVEKMVSQGIVNGKSDGTFDPNGTVTYAQIAKMAVEMVHADQSFDDTQDLGDDWWGGYAGAALDSNLSINGRHLFADTMVHHLYVLSGNEEWLVDTMNTSVSRYDMARILYNMATMMGLEDNGNDVTETIADWDAMAHSHMAEAVHYCYANGILQGDQEGNFNGSQAVTRAQAATVLHRLLDAVETQETTTEGEEKTEEESKEEESKDDSSKDDSSSSKDDSSSSKDDNSSSSSADVSQLNKMLQALLDYFGITMDDLAGDKNDNTDDGDDDYTEDNGADNGGDNNANQGGGCNCEDDDCDSDCGDNCVCDNENSDPTPDENGDPEPDPNGGDPEPNPDDANQGENDE